MPRLRTGRDAVHEREGDTLHLHPVKSRKAGIKLRYTWCMGGITFFLFLVLTFTGLLLMFYYRPTVEYAYADIIDLGEHVPLGVMR